MNYTDSEAGGAPVYALIAAAGSGSRMGSDTNKQLLQLDGIPVIIRSALAFEKHPLITGYRIICAEDDSAVMQNLAEVGNLKKLLGLTCGGSTRQLSVLNGLRELNDSIAAAPDTLVLIHDGARCLVDEETISRCIREIRVHKTACAAAVPVKDTIKATYPDQMLVESTLERSRLWQIQTPQGGLMQSLLKAYEEITGYGVQVTDDLSVMEAAGYPTCLSLGDYRNIKLTTFEDIVIATALLRIIASADQA